MKNLNYSVAIVLFFLLSLSVKPLSASNVKNENCFTELNNRESNLLSGTENWKLKSNDLQIMDRHIKTATTLFMKDGGWCWYQDPRVVINNGKLVIGGVSGVSGDVHVGIFDLKSEKIDGDVMLYKDFQADDHDTPAFYVRPNGSILAVWAKHAGEKVHYYNISSPDNYLKWGDRKEFVHNYDYKSGVTYMNLYYLKNEGKLYNFFRDGLNFNPSFITSSDFGETWGGRTHFIANDVNGRQRPYARYIQCNDSTIGISYTDGHPRNYGNSLYYVEFHNGAFFNVDGSKIMDLSDGPLHTSEAEKIYKGSETSKKSVGYESVPNSAWTCSMAKDGANHPYIGYTLYMNNNDHRFRIATWNGKKWNDREIAFAGKCLYLRESSYTGLMTFDPEDPSRVYISTDVNPSTGEDLGGKHEIYTAKIGAKDDVSTIKWKAITSGSDNRNIRPIVVAKDGYKVLLWLNGSWNKYTDYNVNVLGIILERP